MLIIDEVFLVDVKFVIHYMLKKINKLIIKGKVFIKIIETNNIQKSYDIIEDIFIKKQKDMLKKRDYILISVLIVEVNVKL